MSNSYFSFKQFTIKQERCAMKVGTDGVLLGAWTPCCSASTILDVGTGTGLIALMLAQRNLSAKVDAVEIDIDAASQAVENVKSSPWSDRVSVFNSSFQQYATKSEVRYDLIVSNPPYFQHSLKSPDGCRTIARHTETLSFTDLLAGVKLLLSDKGVFSVILPMQESRCFTEKALTYGLNLCHNTEVIPRPNSNPKRILLSFSFVKSPLKKASLLIETEKRHVYSESFRSLTKEFYLK